MNSARTIAFAGALLLASCSSEAADDTSTPVPNTSAVASEPTATASVESFPIGTSEPTTVVTSTTLLTVASSTASQETTTAPSAEEDWTTVLQSLLTLRDALNAEPDPDRAADVYVPGSEGWALFHDQLINLKADGQRTVDQDPQEVRSVEVLSLVPANEQGTEIANVSAVVYVGPNYGRIVDADGETVYELTVDGSVPADGLYTIVYNLMRTNGGAWLIFDEEAS